MDVVIVARTEAETAPTDANDAPEMTVLESQRRLQAYCQDNADFWREDGHAERALYWQARANSCQEVIDGIIASGDDDWLPF